MHIPRGKVAYALPVILAVILIGAACSGGGGSQKGHVKAGGAASLAWVGASPDFIFPLPPATNTNGYNANWRTRSGRISRTTATAHRRR